MPWKSFWSQEFTERMPLNFWMIVQGKIEMIEPEIQAQTHILMIQSQTLLFSTILQATQMHILSHIHLELVPCNTMVHKPDAGVLTQSKLLNNGIC